MKLKDFRKQALETISLVKNAVQRRAEAIQLSSIGEREASELTARPSLQALQQLVLGQGVDAVLNTAAYTWFNRLCVLRFLEVHDYLPHGYRVLSGEGDEFEIAKHGHELADELGLDGNALSELFLAGDNTETIYRQLLLGQCAALNQAMPFLFAGKDDPFAPLLPEQLTRTDSVIKQFTKLLPDSCWQQLDIFGELFHLYYQVERKALPKKTRIQDLAPATQVSEPMWLSRFMAQNCIVTRWQELKGERIAGEFSYLLEAPAQDEATQDQLAQLRDDSLTPAQLSVCDPACGSGQMLLAAYEVLYELYSAAGYRSRDIPALILNHNLFGLEIDLRAIQISAACLMLRARMDDGRLFSRAINLNLILANPTLDAESPVGAMACPARDESLSGPVAELLNNKFDVVLCYPPNQGILGVDKCLEGLKAIAKARYSETKSNLATMFYSRALELLKPGGMASLILKDSWLFLSRYEAMRDALFSSKSLVAGVQVARGLIADQKAMNAVVVRNAAIADYLTPFCYVDKTALRPESETDGLTFDDVERFPPLNERRCNATLTQMAQVPGRPLAYWKPQATLGAFRHGRAFSNRVNCLSLGLNIDRDKLVRHWWEVAPTATALGGYSESSARWQTLVSGGQFKRWFGNLDYVVDTTQLSERQQQQKLSAEANTWTSASKFFNARFAPAHVYFDPSGPCFAADVEHDDRFYQLGVLNTPVFNELVNTVYPEDVLGSVRPNDLANLPITEHAHAEIAEAAQQLTALAEQDWHEQECSWKFNTAGYLLLGAADVATGSIQSWYQTRKEADEARLQQVFKLENTVNALVADGYGISDCPEITHSALNYHFNPYLMLSEDAQAQDAAIQSDTAWDCHQSTLCAGLINFAMGNIFGRYSCTMEGVLNSEQIEVALSADFAADDDGIVPLSDQALFDDDAANRVREFVKTVWGEESLNENLRFLAESLNLHAIQPLKGKGALEGNLDTIRRYLSNQFFKDHCKMYKNRPIYWLFSSGRQKAFEALVYVHRYNEGTLPRLRTEYVVPLLGKYQAQLEVYAEQLSAAETTAEQKSMEKGIITLEKKLTELRAFDDNLKHYADMKITLDLDDGVKANYGKFGNLLADVKAIHGKAVK